jgi:hypothetical protein
VTNFADFPVVEGIIALIGVLWFVAFLGFLAYGAGSIARGIVQNGRKHESFTSFDRHLPLRGRWLAYLASTPLWIVSVLFGAACLAILILALRVGAWCLMALLSAFSDAVRGY